MALKFKFFLHIATFLFCLCSVAQTSLIDRLHEMQKDPRLKEKVYVHTNKTSYFADDVIWFKAYVGDSINYPSERTKILDVRLFDGSGNNLFAKKVDISEGTGIGQFELSNSVAPGDYYLQARTNYMRNFGDDYHYLQKINVRGKRFPDAVTKDTSYDIQLFPESGNLVEEIDNVMAIKALVNGQGLGFDGKIIDEQGTTITTFQSEHEGMGKCSFFYEKGEKYKAQIKVRDTVLELAVPKALPEGVVLSLDATSDDNNLKVFIKTNEKTFFSQVYSNYSLLYHQDRQLFQLYSVARLDSLTALIETKKDIFLDGVHTVTLFADDKPIAERKFYMETGHKKTSLSLKKVKIETDSIEYKLDLKERKKGLQANLSISVLPESSTTLDQKNTIQSAFLLRPFVKGHIDNPAYYFNIENKKRKEHLDLLLLTQGWTQYSLDDLIEGINPNEKYRFEEGFKLSGSLKEETKHKNLVLIPDDLKVVDKIRLNGQSEFVFQDLKVFKGDTVRVAYQNWLGKIIKPLGIEYDTIEKKGVTKLLVPKASSETSKQEANVQPLNISSKNNSNTLNTETALPRNPDGIIALDEVVVSEKKRSERYLQRRKVIEKYKPMVSDIGKYSDIPISELLNKNNLTLNDFLGQRGFSQRSAGSFQNYLQGTSTFGVLFINGSFIQSEQLPSRLQLQMKDIANIMTSSKVILGPNGQRITLTLIQVFTSEKPKGPFDEFVVQNGYDRNKKYYAPLYAAKQEQPLNLLEIDWKPKLKTNKNGEVFFKIRKNQNPAVLQFSIQGFSEEGHLISKNIFK